MGRFVIHHWLMLLKPGEYMTFPPAFERLSSETIDYYARRSARELNRRYRVIRGKGGRKSRGPVTVIYVR